MRMAGRRRRRALVLAGRLIVVLVAATWLVTRQPAGPSRTERMIADASR